MHGDIFAHDIALTDDELGVLALVFEVLGRMTQMDARIEDAILAQLRMPGDGRMGDHANPVTQFHIRPDHAEGPDLDTVAQLGTVCDNRGGMDISLAHRFSTALAENSA